MLLFRISAYPAASLLSRVTTAITFANDATYPGMQIAAGVASTAVSTVEIQRLLSVLHAVGTSVLNVTPAVAIAPHHSKSNCLHHA